MGAYQEWASATPTAAELKNPSGAASICFPAVASSTSEDLVIPLRVTSYQGVSRQRTVSQKQTIGRLTLSSNNRVGGNFIGVGKMNFATLSISGEMDSPIAQFGIYATPTLRYPTNNSNSYQVTYADIIAACIEGRVYDADNSNFYESIQPLWFRDPFGRVFTKVKIRAFSAAFVEMAPGRQSFSMTLEVSKDD